MKTLKRNFISTLFLGSLFFLGSCTKNIICISPNGDEISETKTFSQIDEVSHDFDGDIVIHQMLDLNEPYAVISGSSNIVKNLETKRRGTKLHFKNDRCTKKSSDLTIDLYVSDLDEINLNGSGSISNLDTFFTSNLNIDINGSGQIDLKLETNLANVHVSGAGDIYLEGNSNSANYSISGSGTIDSYQFEAKEGEVKISGAGKAKVNIIDYLKINISGSGDVYYLGSPNVSQNISGSGSIFKL